MMHEHHAQCLKAIQNAMTDTAQEPEGRKIYETGGVYLGYGLAQYLDECKKEVTTIVDNA